MERLTKRLASGAADYNYPANCYFDDNSGPDRVAKSAFRQLCVERLAEYEDSKLSSEQVMAVKLIIEAAFDDDTTKATRIRELLKADRAGRLIILNDASRQVSLCDICDSGWGEATKNGYDSCFNHCERLKQYRKQGSNNG